MGEEEITTTRRANGNFLVSTLGDPFFFGSQSVPFWAQTRRRKKNYTTQFPEFGTHQTFVFGRREGIFQNETRLLFPFSGPGPSNYICGCSHFILFSSISGPTDRPPGKSIIVSGKNINPLYGLADWVHRTEKEGHCEKGRSLPE